MYSECLCRLRHDQQADSCASAEGCGSAIVGSRLRSRRLLGVGAMLGKRGPGGSSSDKFGSRRCGMIVPALVGILTMASGTNCLARRHLSDRRGKIGLCPVVSVSCNHDGIQGRISDLPAPERLRRPKRCGRRVAVPRSASRKAACGVRDPAFVHYESGSTIPMMARPLQRDWYEWPWTYFFAFVLMVMLCRTWRSCTAAASASDDEVLTAQRDRSPPLCFDYRRR